MVRKMNVEEYRKQIDEIDKDIENLLDKRLKLCKEIGDYKKENNLEVLDQNRENAILEKIDKSNLEHKDEIKEIYKEIFNEGKKVQ